MISFSIYFRASHPLFTLFSGHKWRFSVPFVRQKIYCILPPPSSFFSCAGRFVGVSLLLNAAAAAVAELLIYDTSTKLVSQYRRVAVNKVFFMRQKKIKNLG